jgi:hypothetical protein
MGYFLSKCRGMRRNERSFLPGAVTKGADWLFRFVVRRAGRRQARKALPYYQYSMRYQMGDAFPQPGPAGRPQGVSRVGFLETCSSVRRSGVEAFMAARRALPPHALPYASSPKNLPVKRSQGSPLHCQSCYTSIVPDCTSNLLNFYSSWLYLFCYFYRSW